MYNRKRYTLLIKTTKVKLKKIFSPGGVLRKRLENKINDSIWVRECCTCGETKGLSEYHNSSFWRMWKEIMCKWCQFKRSLRYRRPKKGRNKKTKEQKIETGEIYREKNKEKIAQRRKEHRLMNIEIYKEKNKEYHKRNSAKRNEMTRKWRSENKDNCKERRRKNKHKIKIREHNTKLKRSNRIRSSSDWTVTYESVSDLMVSQKWLCVECLCDITDSYTIDHCKSLFDWWEHSISNIQLMCIDCNCKKNKKSYRIVNWEKIYL